jgi:hypothetical protein
MEKRSVKSLLAVTSKKNPLGDVGGQSSIF